MGIIKFYCLILNNFSKENKKKMGNVSCTQCCSNNPGEFNTDMENKDHNVERDRQELMKLCKDNIRLVVKLQAWARGNKTRKHIANQLNIISG